MSDDRCGRRATIMVNGIKVRVCCTLPKHHVSGEWHIDGFYGEWDEVEELRENG